MSLNNEEAHKKAQILAEALPYIKRFHGRTIVIKYGGNAMIDEDLKQSFARDVVLLKLVGMHPVIVHGGGPQISNMLDRLGKDGTFVQGMRVTDKETMDVVEMVLGAEVDMVFVSMVYKVGGVGGGWTGRDGGLLRAKKLHIESEGEQLDLGQVGEVESVDPGVISTLEMQGFIPVVAPIGYGDNGEAYNINADLVAGKLAMVLNAEKLILMTNTAGILDKNEQLLTGVSPVDIDRLVEDGTIFGGMLPKISSALDAARSGVNSVHIIDGRVENAVLLEVLTDQGVGTLIRSR